VRILWHEQAWAEYQEWLTEDKRLFKKINLQIKDIQRNGYKCLSKPEPLKGNYSGWWSIRINSKDRLVFKIEADNLVILKCKNHYKDK